MFRILSVAAAVGSILFLTPSAVFAWGAAHVGYTHVGPAGAYHVGKTAVATPFGARTTGHVGAVGAGGASYHAGYAAGRGPAGGVYAGGYRAGAVVGYRPGVYPAFRP